MAVTINWTTLTFSVQQSDLTLIGGTLYEADTETDIRQPINAIMAGADGMAYVDPIDHNTEVTVAGVTYSRFIEMINGYSIVFLPDEQWSVRLVGSNNNLFDIEEGILVQNQVQVIPTNSAGLQRANIDNLEKIMKNKMITDPITGILTIYEDDGVTPFLTGNIFADSLGLVPYAGGALERREKLS